MVSNGGFIVEKLASQKVIDSIRLHYGKYMTPQGIVMLKTGSGMSGSYAIELNSQKLEYRIKRHSQVSHVRLDFMTGNIYVNHTLYMDGVDKIIDILSTLAADFKRNAVMVFSRGV